MTEPSEQSYDAGMALITVLLITMVLTTLLIGTLGYATGSMSLSRRDQDWNAAMSAAEAGIDDYMFRLNQGDNYWLYSATKPAPDGNQAFSQYVPVPGATSDALYSYTPDSTTITSDGVIKLTVTGKVRNATRKLAVTLRRSSFLDYLYLTDSEVIDPSAIDANALPGDIKNCEIAGYVLPPNPTRDMSRCTGIVFAGGDVINGPLHSNDWITINGNTTFKGLFTTAWNDITGKLWRDNQPLSSPSNPNFQKGKQYHTEVKPPPSNTDLKAQADPVTGGTGCLYFGPTRITLKDNKMEVTSPLTPNGGLNPGCGPLNAAGGPPGTPTTLNLPANGVVYVQNAPAGVNCPGTGHPLGYPVTGDSTVYGCLAGDAFVSSASPGLSGQLTIGTDNNIVITGDLVYKDATNSSTDILGLIATNFAQVYHPTTSSANITPGAQQDPKISAAIVSLKHSFIVPKWNVGSTLGTLYVKGAIAQHFRGPVGTLNTTTGNSVTGYKKDYNYDDRFKYLSPPHFIQPENAAWQVKRFAELKQ